jgi:hypothetical protein
MAKTSGKRNRVAFLISDLDMKAAIHYRFILAEKTPHGNKARLKAGGQGSS